MIWYPWFASSILTASVTIFATSALATYFPMLPYWPYGPPPPEISPNASLARLSVNGSTFIHLGDFTSTLVSASIGEYATLSSLTLGAHPSIAKTKLTRAVESRVLITVTSSNSFRLNTFPCLGRNHCRSAYVFPLSPGRHPEPPTTPSECAP